MVANGHFKVNVLNTCAGDIPVEQKQARIATIGSQIRVLRTTWFFGLCTAAGAVVAALLLVESVGTAAVLPAYLYFVVIGTLLAAIDATTGKLPDRLTLPSYPILIVLLSFGEVVAPRYGSTVRATAAAVLLMALFFAAALGRGVGLGDVKLVGLLGLVLGFRSWGTVYIGMLTAFMLGTVFVAFESIHRGRRERVPLGPFLVVGTMIALLV